MSFNSKYTGEQVENLLDQVASGNAGGGITTETDPIFSASPASKITDENITSWNNKVDKVNGKQLSTEDFTTALKDKLSDLNNYDDTAINQAVQSLQVQLNTLVSGNASSAVESFNEIIAFLEGIEDSKSLDSIIASIEQQIAGKMDKVTLAAVATSGSYNDLKDKPTIPSSVTESTVSDWGFAKKTDVPTNVSELVNDAKYASAEDTDDVVEEPEGGGSTGSNVYTLDIGEWDGMSDIDDLPITAEVLEDLLSSDCVRIKYTSTDGIDDLYVSLISENKMVDRESNSMSGDYYGQELITGYIVNFYAYKHNDRISASLYAWKQTTHQPVFFLGEYNEETDSWDNSSLVTGEELYYNILTYEEIENKFNSETMYNFPPPLQVIERTLEIVTINRYVFLTKGVVLIYEREGTYSNNKTTWSILIGSDGIPDYIKIG